MSNAELGFGFTHRHALRQGTHCPRSPMLFTIAIAPLHLIFAKANSVGEPTPLHFPPSQPRVNLYANVAVLLINTSDYDIKSAKAINRSACWP